jgi:hypothetical protein
MFGIQIKVHDPDPTKSEWKLMRHSESGKYYVYDTRELAQRVLEMCYPDSCADNVRVKEITE